MDIGHNVVDPLLYDPKVTCPIQLLILFIEPYLIGILEVRI